MPSSGGMRFRVDGQGGLAKLARDLKNADPALRRMLTRELKNAGQPVAAAVRQAAEAQGLHKAAGAVSVQFRASQKRAGLTIAVSSKKAPYARPLDSGSQGRRTGNRHPVFGRGDKTRDQWTWVNQPTRPFWADTIARETPKVGQRLVDAMTTVSRAAGFTK